MSEKPEEKEALEESAAEISKENKSESIKEVDGREGLEPTRYGDWEKNGRCIDF